MFYTAVTELSCTMRTFAYAASLIFTLCLAAALNEPLSFDSLDFSEDFDLDSFLCPKLCQEFLRVDGCCPSEICKSSLLSLVFFQETKVERYNVIQTCPLGYGTALHAACELVEDDDYMSLNISTRVFVTAGELIFYNKYCAECYNIHDYEMWSLQISCSTYKEFQNLKVYQDIVNKAMTSFQCSVNMISPPQTQADNCRVLAGDILGDDKRFFTGGSHTTGKLKQRLESGRTPLSIIISFNDFNDVKEVEDVEGNEDNSSCPVGQWSHNLTDVCFEVHCAAGKRYIEDKCVSLIKEGKGIVYTYTQKLQTHSEVCLDECGLQKSSRAIVVNVTKSLGIRSFEAFVSSSYIQADCSKGFEVTVSLKLVITEPKNKIGFESSVLAMMDTVWNLECSDRRIELVSEFSHEDLVEGWRHTKETGSEGNIPFASFAIRNIQPEFLELAQHRSAFIHVTPVLMCPFVIFSSDAFVNDMKGNLVVDDIVLEKGDYDLQGGEAMVCVDVLEEKYETLSLSANDSSMVTPENIHVVILWYLSTVCIVISLLGLLITFIVYMVFPTLRTLPAKNNICLVFNLFWAQSLLQFGVQQTEQETACVALGILIHFFWLASLLSMNVCSYHMYSVFRAKTLNAVPRPTKRLLIYLGYMYSVSAAVVIVTVVSQYIITDGTGVGYGGRHCYLSSALLVGICFACPLGLILLANGIMFVLAVRAIAHTTRIQEEVMAKGRQNLHVYIKLSTLTGLFWIVGILAEVFQLQALIYISILLNGSQGAFICIAIVCNRRVLNLAGCTKIKASNQSASDRSKVQATRTTSM